MPNREDYIVDGDDDESNDCEQSDIVNIILNLALVDSKFAKEFRFGKGVLAQTVQNWYGEDRRTFN